MMMSKTSRKWILGAVALGAVGLSAAHASAGASLWWNINGQSAVLKNPAADQSAWSNSYGHMVHNTAGTNELDFSIPLPKKSIATGSNFDLLGGIFGNNNGGYGSYCGQQLAVGEDGTIVASPYVCAAAGAPNVYFQTLMIPASSYNTVSYSAFTAVWVTGSATVDLVTYAYLPNPYTLAP